MFFIVRQPGASSHTDAPCTPRPRGAARPDARRGYAHRCGRADGRHVRIACTRTMRTNRYLFRPSLCARTPAPPPRAGLRTTVIGTMQPRCLRIRTPAGGGRNPPPIVPASVCRSVGTRSLMRTRTLLRVGDLQARSIPLFPMHTRDSLISRGRPAMNCHPVVIVGCSPLWRASAFSRTRSCSAFSSLRAIGQQCGIGFARSLARDISRCGIARDRALRSTTSYQWRRRCDAREVP